MSYTIREALIAMSYREVKPGHWLKPIGFMLFSYHEEKSEWANWFMARDDETTPKLWDAKKFENNQEHYGDYLHQLKHWECYTRTDMNPRLDSAFHLSAFDL